MNVAFGFAERLRFGGAVLCVLLAAALLRDHRRNRSAQASVPETQPSLS